MDALRLALALLVLALATPASGDPVDRWQPYIAEASLRCATPARWIVEVMRAESGGATSRDGRPIRSPKGAIGLMQLMPATWDDMRSRLGLGTDPDDPHDNILAGSCYLRLMYDRFGYPGLFGAYNAGPERYAAWLAGQARLPSETIAYLAKLAPRSGTAPEAAAPIAPPALFAVRGEPVPAPAPAVPDYPPSSLFAVRKAPQ